MKRKLIGLVDVIEYGTSPREAPEKRCGGL